MTTYVLHGCIFSLNQLKNVNILPFHYIRKSLPEVCFSSFLRLFNSVLISGFCRRLFGGKQSKQAPVTTAENMKNSTVISNPHATLNHVATVLESPDGGPVGGDSETNSLLFGGRVHGSGMGTLGSEPVRKKHMKNKRLYYLF